MTGSDSGPPAEFVDVGTPLSPAKAGTLESDLERRGIATRLRICGRDADGRDRQAVQVAPGDLDAAIAFRAELFPATAAPEAPPVPRSHRLRNAAIAAALGLVGSLRVVRLVRIPAGPRTALVVVGVAAVLFTAVFGLTRES